MLKAELASKMREQNFGFQCSHFNIQRLTFPLEAAVRYNCGSFLQPFICCYLLLFARGSEDGYTWGKGLVLSVIIRLIWEPKPNLFRNSSFIVCMFSYVILPLEEGCAWANNGCSGPCIAEVTQNFALWSGY